ncbi:MAG: hypothetical protein HY233_03035 [Acidobacteriales bacterium]|nr:hypothetical protein [Candidatus Koribacter versatilis]MBI3644927.1 hypothetical protein [Terriglobales bacterium]
MNLDELLAMQRPRVSAGKQLPGAQYTARDFQLEVLEKLAETQALAASLSESWRNELRAIKEQNRTAKLDTRSLIAMGAIAVSIAGYVIQDARNTSRQDAEIETTKTRVTSLEKIAATTTEARIRSEVELKELREGQEEIKQLLLQHGNNTANWSRERRSRNVPSGNHSTQEGEQ